MEVVVPKSVNSFSEIGNLVNGRPLTDTEAEIRSLIGRQNMALHAEHKPKEIYVESSSFEDIYVVPAITEEAVVAMESQQINIYHDEDITMSNSKETNVETKEVQQAVNEAVATVTATAEKAVAAIEEVAVSATALAFAAKREAVAAKVAKGQRITSVDICVNGVTIDDMLALMGFGKSKPAKRTKVA